MGGRHGRGRRYLAEESEVDGGGEEADEPEAEPDVEAWASLEPERRGVVWCSSVSGNNGRLSVHATKTLTFPPSTSAA